MRGRFSVGASLFTFQGKEKRKKKKTGQNEMKQKKTPSGYFVCVCVLGEIKNLPGKSRRSALPHSKFWHNFKLESAGAQSSGSTQTDLRGLDTAKKTCKRGRTSEEKIQRDESYNCRCGSRGIVDKWETWDYWSPAGRAEKKRGGGGGEEVDRMETQGERGWRKRWVLSRATSLSSSHPFLPAVLLRCLAEKRRRQICSLQPQFATNEFRLHPNELLAELLLDSDQTRADGGGRKEKEEEQSKAIQVSGVQVRCWGQSREKVPQNSSLCSTSEVTI